jgi:ABC-type Mn2+/Zn2+ transport system permease subunit
MAISLLILLLTGALVGAASGYLGSFMVLKRMSLVGDALSHVALPGMAIALTLSIDPALGAFVALAFAIVGIWYLGEHTEVYSEALVGIFFTGSLAVGILVTPEPELLEALFGNLEKIGLVDGVVTIVAAVGIFLIAKRISEQLLLGVVSEDLARTAGVDNPKINLVYLLLVGLIVALGVKFVGTLLMGALFGNLEKIGLVDGRNAGNWGKCAQKGETILLVMVM